MLYIIAYIFFKWLLWLIYRPKVFGNKKNLRIKGGVIYCESQSVVRSAAIGSQFTANHSFYGKKRAFRQPCGESFF